MAGRLLFLLLGLALAGAPAHAGLISTDEAVAAQDRERLNAFLERPEAAGQLEKMGIRLGEAQGRIGAMTDEEVRSLAGRLNRLPAGGQMTQPEIVMWLVLILVVLLIG